MGTASIEGEGDGGSRPRVMGACGLASEEGWALEAGARVGLGRPSRKEGPSWALRQKGRPGRPERLGSSLPLFALLKNNRKRGKFSWNR